MAAIGAKYKWKEGKILHAARLWKSPTKRRIPRMLIEDRALEVGIKMYLELPWLIFEETNTSVEQISQEGAIPLQFYQGRYHLLPAKIEEEDTYKWLQNPQHALLLWGKGNTYFIKTIPR